MEYNLKFANMHEKEIYQRYVDECKVFYAGSTITVYMAATIVILAPLIIPNQISPVEANYPFNVEYEPIKTIIYLHQSIVIFQTVFNINHICLIGLLIWFTAARFEILSHQFRRVNNINDIIVCIQQHIKLLRYAQEVIIAVRSVMLVIMIVCSFAIVVGGLVIVNDSGLADRTQFTIMCLAALLEVYACAWPADYLMGVSINVAKGAYEIQWYNKEVTLQRNVSFILFRSQIPIAISVSAMLPVLSLNYFASYVSTAFSYLMTLRVILFLE